MLCEEADRRLLHSRGFCLADAAPGVRFLGARLPPLGIRPPSGWRDKPEDLLQGCRVLG